MPVYPSIHLGCVGAILESWPLQLFFSNQFFYASDLKFHLKFLPLSQFTFALFLPVCVLFFRELMSQTREPRQRRVWGRRTPPRGQPIPRHRAVRSRKSQSNQLCTCRTHLTLSTCVHRLSRHLVTYQTLPCDREMCNVLLSVWQEEQSCLQEHKNAALYIFLICLSHLTDICCRTSAFKNHFLKSVNILNANILWLYKYHDDCVWNKKRKLFLSLKKKCHFKVAKFLPFHHVTATSHPRMNHILQHI